MFRTTDLETMDLKAEPNPLDQMCASSAFAIRATYHTSLKATPTQRAFGCDMFFPVQYLANWHATTQALDARRREDNVRENKGRANHTYQVGDFVLIRRDRGEVLPKLARPTIGPFRVVAVHVNGTVTIDRHSCRETIHIRRLIPYHH